MACMEHECRACHKVIFNNQRYMDCPNCGAEMSSTFDEVPDYDYDRDDDRDEDY